MKIRNLLIIIFFLALAVVAIFVACRMLWGLQEKKIRYEVDPYTLIPVDCKAVFHFRDAHYFSHPVTADFSAVLWDRILNNLIVSDLYISLHHEGAVLYKKMAIEEIEAFLLPLSGGFRRETVRENNTKIHIITTNDNRFFCYLYHQGVWIGSLRKRLLDKVIETLKSENTLRDDSLFSHALEGGGNKVMANVVFNTDSINYIHNSESQESILCSFPHSWVGFDLTQLGNDLWLSGIVTDNVKKTDNEKRFFMPDLLPYNCFLVYQSCDGYSYDVCFGASDSVSKSGRVKVLPIESHEHYNRFLDEEPVPKEVFIYNDYALFADSISIIDTFVASLAPDSLRMSNSLFELFASFDHPKEDVFAVDLGAFLCNTQTLGFLIPAWLWEQKELLLPYSLYHYTYTEENNRFFNLILSPKK